EKRLEPLVRKLPRESDDLVKQDDARSREAEHLDHQLRARIGAGSLCLLHNLQARIASEPPGDVPPQRADLGPTVCHERGVDALSRADEYRRLCGLPVLDARRGGKVADALQPAEVGASRQMVERQHRMGLAATKIR